MLEKKLHLFEEPGEINTEKCMEIAGDNLRFGYKYIVLATTKGTTALKFGQYFRGNAVKIVAVTHSTGFEKPSAQQVPEETREEIRSLGIELFTGTILTHSLEAALSKKHSGIYPTQIIASTYRTICQGVKVCAEIVMEACDAGLIPESEEVIAVAGTGWGADTVCVVKSQASKRFLDLRILEILAKPRA
ncbi:MAG: hypothetical protein JW728_02445 [Candidatus Aureabacteria bacterium]|nr:hypothetical protein [Candidatus Auribacterota bacterium]